MIDLKQLVQLAPYPEDTKMDLITKVDSLNEQQKSDLENLSWDLIREAYEDKVAYISQQAIAEMALGKKEAKDINLEKIEEDIFIELSSKIEGINAQDALGEIREKLQAQTSKTS